VKYNFKELPGPSADHLRPAVPVVVEGMPRAPQLCLIDTGALHNRFARWVAEAAGIDLAGAEEQTIALGGFTMTASLATVPLRVAEHTWEAPVWFCEPWPLAFHLLGQEGFLRWFDVRLRAAVHELEITADDLGLPLRDRPSLTSATVLDRGPVDERDRADGPDVRASRPS
jgi:hypothetical protein